MLNYCSSQSEPLPQEVKEPCDCRCRKLHSSEDWKCCRCVWTDEVCFPGDAHVQLPSGHSIPISALKIGQKVLTGKAVMTLVPIYDVHNLSPHFRQQKKVVSWTIRTSWQPEQGEGWTTCTKQTRWLTEPAVDITIHGDDVVPVTTSTQ